MKKIIVLLMFLMVALSVSAISAANDADNFNDNGVLVVEHDTLIVENNNPAMDVDNMVNVADDSSGVVNIPLPHEDPVNISDEEGVSSIPASDVFWNNSTIGDDLNNVSSGVVNIPLPHVDSVNISDEEGVSSIPASGFHP